MTKTSGDIRVGLDGEMVVLTLINLPLGEVKVFIPPDKWNALVTEVLHQRSTLRIKARTKAYTAADVAKVVENTA